MPKAVKWRQTNNCTIMFDLLKLIQKKEELKFALSGVNCNSSNSYYSFGCEGTCAGSCTGGCQGDCANECMDSSRGHFSE